MKILILGATGRTGKLICEAAQKKGYQIAAIARNPSALKDYPAEVTQGTPYDLETVKKAIRGCDAVINTLNVSRRSDSPWAPLSAPEDLISRSAANALKAMEAEGVRRFVALGAIGAGRSWKKSPAILKLIVNMSNLKYAFRDHGRQEELLEQSNVDYTICRAPMLSDKHHEKGVAAIPEGDKPASMVLSRNAAAAFFLQIIENGEHIRETITISNKPG